MSGGFTKAPVWKVATRKLGDTPKGGGSAGAPHWSALFASGPDRLHHWGVSRPLGSNKHQVGVPWVYGHQDHIVAIPMFFPRAGSCTFFFKQVDNSTDANARLRFSVYDNFSDDDPRPHTLTGHSPNLDLSVGGGGPLRSCQLGSLTVRAGDLWWLAHQASLLATNNLLCTFMLEHAADPFLGHDPTYLNDPLAGSWIGSTTAWMASGIAFADPVPPTFPTTGIVEMTPINNGTVPAVFIDWRPSA